MPILNYSTKISADRTSQEIISILVKQGAKQILLDFRPDVGLQGLQWHLDTATGPMAFAMPVRVDAVFQVLTRQGILKRNEVERRRQAERTAWRIVLEWTKAQIALIETEMVAFEEVFLPYALAGGQTFYQALMLGQFPALTGGTPE